MQQGYQQQPPQQGQQQPGQGGHPQQGQQQPPPQQGYQQPPPGQYQQHPQQQHYGPPPKKFPIVPVIIIVVVIIAVLVLAVILLGGGGTNTMTPSEWNAEYNAAYSSFTSLDYPNLNDGDTVVIAGQISDIDYSGDYGFGYGDTTELELNGVTLDGLEWEGNLGNAYNVGDNVEITFHIAGDTLYGYSVEYIQEMGLYGDYLPSTTIKKA